MFDIVEKFEKQIAEFYRAPYAVATDCCTHAIELCLRMTKPSHVSCPSHTYISIPMTFEKLNLSWSFIDRQWEDFYYIDNTRIIDAAVYWKENSYIENTLFCLSFQYRKHLNLYRGGAILCSNVDEYNWLKQSSYDGRMPNTAWADQDIDQIGYHYYMTPETAQLGIDRLPSAVDKLSKKWNWTDYPDVSKMKVFNEKSK
jgi:dTDP-4-amino-4,6-dideoxygalactose transaminase